MFGSYRFVLAIFVLISHILGARHVGGAAVFSFYILSGFLMTHIMKERYSYNVRSFKSFCFHRCLRLFPMYWVALVTGLVLILVAGSDFSSSVNKHIYMPDSIGSWLWNIFMFSPSLYPIDFEPRVITPAWALTVEIVYYILIAFGISKNAKITIAWFSISILYYFSTYPLGYDYGWRSKGLLCASLPFSAGALLYYLKDKFHLLKSSQLNIKILALVTSSALSILGYLTLNFTSPKWADLIFNLSIIPSFLMIAFLYPTTKPKNTQKVRKVDNFLGSASYPLYVLHWPVTLWVVHITGLSKDLGFNIHGLTVFALTIGIILIITYLFEKYCEPNIRKLRKLI